MPKSIGTPLEKTFRLDKFDPDGDTTVTIRQATQAQNERRNTMFDEVSRVYNDAEQGQVEVRQKLSWEKLKRTEVFLTMCSCNILGGNDQPLFAFTVHGTRQVLSMSETAFNEAWGYLPPDVATEIWEKVREVNPAWGPKGE